MNITIRNIDKLVMDLKEDLKVDKLSDQDLLIDELVKSFVDHEDCDDIPDLKSEIEELEKASIDSIDKLERIERIINE